MPRETSAIPNVETSGSKSQLGSVSHVDLSARFAHQLMFATHVSMEPHCTKIQGSVPRHAQSKMDSTLL